VAPDPDLRYGFSSSIERRTRETCVKKSLGLATLALSSFLLAIEPAGALSAELARKCLDRTLKEYPRPKGWVPYKAGHPGMALARQAYYRDCIAKEGNI